MPNLPEIRTEREYATYRVFYEDLDNLIISLPGWLYDASGLGHLADAIADRMAKWEHNNRCDHDDTRKCQALGHATGPSNEPS